MIAWLARALADVPADDDWLGDDERRALAKMRIPKRRADFRLGRWTARQALGGALGARDWTIVPREDGSPEARVDGAPVDVSLSISHSAGRALAAVASGALALGCDLERIEPRDEALVREFFEDSERSLLDLPDEARGGLSREAAVTVLWCAKESALKAHRVGLREDPRKVVVTLEFPARPDGFRACSVRVGGECLRGVWRVEGDFALALAAEPWVEPLVWLDSARSKLRTSDHCLRADSTTTDRAGGQPCRTPMP